MPMIRISSQSVKNIITDRHKDRYQCRQEDGQTGVELFKHREHKFRALHNYVKQFKQ